MSEIPNLLVRATQLHQAGHLAQAEELYRQNPAADPRNADALHLLGVIACQANRPDAGAQLIQQALTSNPSLFHAYNSLGNAFKAMGRLEDAAGAYRKLLRYQPNVADAHCNLGAAL